MRERCKRIIESVGERYAGLEHRGPHTRPGSYRVAEPKWEKENAEHAAQGLPPLFAKYPDKQTNNFIRARYKVDPKTKELTTDPKVLALERVLVRNTPPLN